MTKKLSDKERIEKFNLEAEQLKFKHKLRQVPSKEILDNRSSAYEFIDLDKL